MRAIHIAAPREIAFLDAPTPEPDDGQVLVRCSHVALCGSNMGQYTGEGVWGDLDYPNPTGWAGHENIGTIVESRCDGWEPGQLVLAQPDGYFGFAEYIVASVLDCSLLRKITAMSKPTITPNTIAPITRATPSSKPRTRAVRKMASTLMAGPA